MPSFNFGQYPSLASRFFNNYNFQNPYGYQSNSPMAGRSNPLAATFQQPLPPPIQEQPQTQDQPPPDFMSEYQKLVGNRPQKLAYEDAVNEGQPQIQRSKWARLGTALTSGAAALGGDSIGDAAKLGTDAYWAPQERANRDYQAKVTRLGQAAGFEQSDMQDKVKALEMKQKDWYDRRQDYREQLASIDRSSLTKAQIKESEDQIRERNTDKWTDTNGDSWERGPDDIQPRKIGHVKPSMAEEVTQRGAITKSEEEAKAPFERAADARRAASAAAVATIGATSREKIATDKNVANAASLRSKLEAAYNKPNASEDYKRGIVNLHNAIVADPTLEEYVKQDATGSFRPATSSDFWGTLTPEENIKIEKVRQALQAGAPKLVPAHTPGVNVGGDNTSNVAGKIPQQTKTLKDPKTGATFTAYSDDGGKTWYRQ